MRTSTRLLAPVLILVLAVAVAAMPATAFAQSAGDDQYVDPFQNSGGGNDGGSQGGGDGDDTSGGNGEVAPAPAETAPSTAAQTGDGGGLPTTGLAIGGVALTGVLLLGGGMALRRWRPHS
jgi:hypothetical protein